VAMLWKGHWTVCRPLRSRRSGDEDSSLTLPGVS